MFLDDFDTCIIESNRLFLCKEVNMDDDVSHQNIAGTRA